jgi:hypothetical protein
VVAPASKPFITTDPSKGPIMNPVKQVSRTPAVTPAAQNATAVGAASLPTWRLNVMRVGYLVMAVGLAVTKWPEFLRHEPWELKEGTVLTMLVAMSVLALLGLRYPRQMLPILLFEVGWKLLWLAVVALPLWASGTLTGATLEEAAKVLWVVIIIAVIPWRHVVRQFVLARGDRWR